MLQAIRNHVHGILAWIMLIVIGVPFALWGIQNYLETGKEQPAAVVEGHEILDREVNRAYEQNLANWVGLADFDEKQLKKEVLEKLIREELVLQKAEKSALVISDDDVRGLIQTLPYFQTDGKFDKDKYKAIVAAQGMTSDQLAAQIRRALIMEQFQKSIVDSTFFTKNQFETWQRLKNQERDIEYVTLPLPISERSFDEKEIESYYQTHLSQFKNPEKVSVDYIALQLSDLAQKVEATEADLHNLYEEQKTNFGTPERRKISHILIQIENKDEKAALEKAKSLRDRIVKGEDFSKLASEFSADTASSKSGGDLGIFNQESVEESFAQSVLSLKMGEISEPVKTSFGYHLIKLTEWTPAQIKPFEEVQKELIKTFQHNAAETTFYNLGQTLSEQAYEHPDSLEPAAKLLHLKIEQTSLFTREAGEGLASESAVREAAFGGEVLGGRNSDPIELSDQKAVVLRVKEHQPASNKPLSEVKDLIVASLKQEEAQKKVAKSAQELLQKVRETDGHSLENAVKPMNLSVLKLSSLRRKEDKKAPTALVNAVFKAPKPAKDGKPSVGSVKLDNGEQIVFTVLAVKDGKASPEETQEQESVQKGLVRMEGQRQFSAFLTDLRESADVKIKPDSQ